MSTQTAELRELELKTIIPSPDNPRLVNEKSDGFQELIESIKAMGVKVPVQVRDHPREKGRFDLLAGERRLLASARAGKETIPAIYHGVMSDDEAFEITFAENFSREDLSPLEQGKAVATLMVRYKGDTQAVASKMGKSVRWVLQRVALSKNLSKEWKKAIIEDRDYRHWTASHLQLIAALPVNIQNELLKDYEDSIYDFDGIIPVKELGKEIAEHLRLLDKAKWDFTDSKLVKDLQACSKCIKRSSHQPGLFDDTTDKKEAKKNDRCLDRQCWDVKMTAWLRGRIDELRKEHANLACIVTESPGLQRGNELNEKFSRMIYHWKVSKEGAKGAIPALVVFGNDIGELRWVKFPQTSTSSGRGQKVPGTPTPLKERRVMLNKKRWSIVIKKVLELVEEGAVEKIVSGDRILTVMALASVFGIDGEPNTRGSDWKLFDKKINSVGDEVLAGLWSLVKDRICGDLSYVGPITQTPDKFIEGTKRISKLLSIDFKAILKEVSKTKYREPKSWASLNEDGTPKAVKAKKTKKEKSAKKGKAAKSNKNKSVVRTCRVCGCTNDKPCLTAEGPCCWIEKDLCSACEGK